MSKRKIAQYVFITLFVIFCILVAVPIYKDKNLRYRVSYAFFETAKELQPIVEKFYDLNKHFPKNNSVINGKSELAFPAGGGGRIEQEGRIRIWFDSLPELKEAEIWIIPHKNLSDKNVVLWKCEGNDRGKELINRYLANRCNVRQKN